MSLKGSQGILGLGFWCVRRIEEGVSVRETYSAVQDAIEKKTVGVFK